MDPKMADSVLADVKRVQNEWRQRAEAANELMKMRKQPGNDWMSNEVILTTEEVVETWGLITLMVEYSNHRAVEHKLLDTVLTVAAIELARNEAQEKGFKSKASPVVAAIGLIAAGARFPHLVEIVMAHAKKQIEEQTQKSV